MSFLQNILKSELYKHSFFSIFFNLSTAIINIGIVMILTRVFSKEEFSRYVIFLISTNLVALLALQGYGPIISKAIINNNHAFVKKSLSEILSFSLKVIPVYYLGVAVYYYITLKVDMSLLFLIAGLFIPIHACDKAEAIFMGLNRFKKMRWIKIFNSFLSFSLIGGTAYFTHNLTYVLIAFMICRVVSVGLGMQMAISHLDYNLRGEITEGDLKKEGNQLSLMSLVNVMVENLDKIALYNLGAVGLANFHTGSNIPLKFKDYIKMGTNIPTMAWLKKGDDYFLIKMKKFGVLLFIGIFLLCLLISYLAKFYIPFLFGEKYIDAILVARIMSFSILTNVLGGMLLTRMIMRGNLAMFQKINYVKTSLYLLAIFPTVYYFKEVGAAYLVLIMSILYFVVHLFLFLLKKD